MSFFDFSIPDLDFYFNILFYTNDVIEIEKRCYNNAIHEGSIIHD
jgi:hypothetical protein